ncbi:hypothetical protein RSOLAG1IB_01245 [Rhizoctonia solani AG-1 IB]|uniref:Uncharacterized protein n=1 Tax=Thanatephorus cucumeris (strain AG1-IB / isolate 7/3/14) TaxID=1108050 RepID=A0A0B7FB02_THACB|nr:hypothetical protein RSOLAG1IB_01245 [Rhizoctonia solani AG-1 IB]
MLVKSGHPDVTLALIYVLGAAGYGQQMESRTYRPSATRVQTNHNLISSLGRSSRRGNLLTRFFARPFIFSPSRLPAPQNYHH